MIALENSFLFLNFLEDISPVCGATDTPILDFWCCILFLSKLEQAALFTLGRAICDVCSLRFTSGVPPADLLAASMAAELIFPMYLQAGIGGA